MRRLFYIEIYKLFKQKLFFFAVFLIALIVSLYKAFYTIKRFNDQFSYWSRVSHDPNPYNFLVNKATWTASLTTLFCMLLWGFAITSMEYKNNTIYKIEMSGEGLRKIIYSKTLLLFLLGVSSLFISLITYYFVFINLPLKYETVFKGYSFLTYISRIEYIFLLALCVLKIAAFHNIVMVIVKKHYYMALLTGLLSMFIFMFNYLPYGFYYRTYSTPGLAKLVITYNIFGFFISISLYFLFFNDVIQKKVKKLLLNL